MVNIAFVCRDNGLAIGVSLRVSSFVLHADGTLDTRTWSTNPEPDGAYNISMNRYVGVVALSVRPTAAETSETLTDAIRRTAKGKALERHEAKYRSYVVGADGQRTYYS